MQIFLVIILTMSIPFGIWQTNKIVGISFILISIVIVFGYSVISIYRSHITNTMQAPNYSIAKRMKIGNFKDSLTFQQAQKVKAKNISQFQTTKDLGAPNLQTAQKVLDTDFSNYQEYQLAQRLGVTNSQELQLMKQYQVLDKNAAIEIKQQGLRGYFHFLKSNRSSLPSLNDKIRNSKTNAAQICSNCGQRVYYKLDTCPKCNIPV